MFQVLLPVLYVNSGILTNAASMTVAPYQTVTFSSKTRTATVVNNQYVTKSDPGAYRSV